MEDEKSGKALRAQEIDGSKASGSRSKGPTLPETLVHTDNVLCEELHEKPQVPQLVRALDTPLSATHTSHASNILPLRFTKHGSSQKRADEKPKKNDKANQSPVPLHGITDELCVIKHRVESYWADGRVGIKRKFSRFLDACRNCLQNETQRSAREQLPEEMMEAWENLIAEMKKRLSVHVAAI